MGARRAPVVPAAGAGDVAPGFAVAGAAGALAAAPAGRSGNAGRSAVRVGAGAIGVVFDTVGRNGDGGPPLATPALGAARPDGGAAGGASVGGDCCGGPLNGGREGPAA